MPNNDKLLYADNTPAVERCTRDDRSTKTRRHARKRKGSLTIEWIALVTVLVIGILGGLGVVRNALVSEFQDLTESICETDVLDEQLGPNPNPPGP
jgi:hypothetical protein